MAFSLAAGFYDMLVEQLAGDDGQNTQCTALLYSRNNTAMRKSNSKQRSVMEARVVREKGSRLQRLVCGYHHANPTKAQFKKWS